jgi:thiosulfate/3-mercaptopyruvate sulfurtransferase
MSFGPLVSADWLAQNFGAVTIVDARWNLAGPPGLEEYRAGHIPTAIHLDMDTDLSAPASTEAGRHPLPTPDAFAATLGRAGIPEGRRVVVYDSGPGAQAARLWFMLHVLKEPVAVLDGGLVAWRAIGGGLSTSTPTPTPVGRAAKPWPPERFVDADQLAAAVAAGGAVVYDARTADRYEQGGPIDPRPGHIPGALSAPWQQNVADDGRFRSPDTLRARFEQAAGERVIAYCGSGVTACHDLLALELAGLADTALYPGSWSQWGADATRPARTGSDPS